MLKARKMGGRGGNGRIRGIGNKAILCFVCVQCLLTPSTQCPEPEVRVGPSPNAMPRRPVEPFGLGGPAKRYAIVILKENVAVSLGPILN